MRRFPLDERLIRRPCFQIDVSLPSFFMSSQDLADQPSWKSFATAKASGGMRYLFVLICALAIGAVAISNQSLWIDEGTSAFKAVQPTLKSWAAVYRQDGSSNLQLPLHFLYLWSWEKVFGSSEIALRGANLPLFLLGVTALSWGFRARPRTQLFLLAVVLLNAFTWYYLGEARPYILLFAGSALCLGSLAESYFAEIDSARSRFSFYVFWTGILLLCATSLLAAPWAAGFIAGRFIVLGRENFLTELRRHWVCTLLCFTALACLGGYYLWTISLGARPTNVTRIGLGNLLFAIYEQLGLAGLGPGRTELRQDGTDILKLFAIPLGFGILSLAAPLISGMITFAGQKDKKLLLLAVFVVVLPLLIVVLAGQARHVRILGRHLMPLFLFISLGLGLGLERSSKQSFRLASVAVGFFFLLQTISALEIRFAPRHARDDYRSAAALAIRTAENGAPVWWAADLNTGSYYHVPLDQSGSQVKYVMNPALDQLTGWPEPQLILLSKRDIYDGTGAIDAYIKSRGFQVTRHFQSFEILGKPASR